ncbi:MAG: hypothetical protein AAGF98_17185, partial [Cyanobacteria bacterium P01_H01_bin.153]
GAAALGNAQPARPAAANSAEMLNERVNFGRNSWVMDGAPDEWLTVEPPLASDFTAIAAHSARPILLRFCGGAGAARDGFPGTKSWGFLGLSSSMSF